jgi:hypothetical protein
MSDPLEQYKDLAEQLRPIEEEAMRIKLAMLPVVGRIALNIVREAFPNATLVTIQAAAEIKPSDYGNSARETVKILQDRGITPNLLIYDRNRHVLVVATSVPATAKA